MMSLRKEPVRLHKSSGIRIMMILFAKKSYRIFKFPSKSDGKIELIKRTCALHIDTCCDCKHFKNSFKERKVEIILENFIVKNSSMHYNFKNSKFSQKLNQLFKFKIIIIRLSLDKSEIERSEKRKR